MLYRKKDFDRTREIILPERILSKDKISFLEMVNNFVSTDLECLQLNFDETQMIDSAGLGFLLITLQETNNYNKELLLKNPQEHVSNIFHQMNFDKMFNIEEKK